MFTFDRILNVVLVAAVLYGVVILRPKAPAPPVVYAAGETAPAIPGISYGEAKRTAVLFVRSTCHYCTDSMPFYQSLKAKGARLVAISAESKDLLDPYLASYGLPIESATVGHAAWSKLSGTPTVIVVDRSGQVVGSWLGLLSDNDQRSVRDSLQ